MKRIILFVSVFVFLLSVAGISESLDLSSMSTEELLQLQSNITEEIHKRSDTDTASSFKKWYDFGLGQYLPDPAEIIGCKLEPYNNIQINTDSMFSEFLSGASKDDYELYVEALKAFGYNENIQSYGTGYIATRNGKYTVTVVYVDFSSVDSPNYMSVSLDIAS